MSFMHRLNEPIQRKVIILFSILLGLCATFVGLERMGDHATGTLRQAMANEESRDRIATAMLNELLLIKNNATRLIAASPGSGDEATVALIQHGLSNLSDGLTLLKHGGSFTYTMSSDSTNAADSRETARYQAHAGAQASPGLKELAAAIETIKQSIEPVVLALHDPPASRRTDLRQRGRDLARTLNAQFAHCLGIIVPVIYETHREVGRLREQINQARKALDIVRYSASAVILAIVLILCLRTLQQIGRILKEKESYALHLRQSKQSIRQILEALPVGMLLIDEDRHIRLINKTALEMIGAKDAEKKIGQKCTDFLCSLEEDQCPLNTGAGASFSNEIYLRSEVGINPIVLRKAIALDFNGKPAILETFVDISKHKRDEQSLIEKQNYINKILEAATVGILVVDGKDFTIVEANPAAADLIGVTRQTLIGSHSHKWIRRQSADTCLAPNVGQCSDPAESELCTAEGRTVPIIKNVSTTLLGGRMHLVESFVDITRLKSAEEEARRLNEELEQRVVQRTAELEKANQDLKTALRDLKETQSRLLQSEKMASIGQLAAGVAHEINNPVGFVKSNLHAIDDYRKDLTRLIGTYEALITCLGQQGKARDQVPGYLDKAGSIKKEIDFNYIMDDFENVVTESLDGLQRVTKIVSDLKNFAHMKADETEWIDINESIESTLNIVWNELKYKAEVIKELNKLPNVRCYPQRINQVIMNLLVNAGQAIRQNGRILIKTSASDSHVTIAISDTGEGIAPENLNKIFDPFFTTKEVGKGTGLGLNVVYNIVKSHKGRIDVESTPGQGTTFTIELPVEPEFDEPPAES